MPGAQAALRSRILATQQPECTCNGRVSGRVHTFEVVRQTWFCCEAVASRSCGLRLQMQLKTSRQGAQENARSSGIMEGLTQNPVRKSSTKRGQVGSCDWLRE